MLRNRRAFLTVLANQGPSDTTAPTLTITALSAVANVVAMQIVASEAVTGFEVGDITISGGSLASFATADNITFTVSWTLAAGANTMDIAAEVCQDAAGNNNTAAEQFAITYLVLQPDSTTALDTFINSASPGANSSANATLRVGNTYRSIIKFDLSSIPAGSTVLWSRLGLYCNGDVSSNARTFRVFRLLLSWVLAQVTWNARSVADGNWNTAGAFGAADCEQSDIGNRDFTASETLNEFKYFTLTASAIQAMITGGAFTNNGFLIKADTESADQYNFASANDATAGNRPIFEVVYVPN